MDASIYRDNRLIRDAEGRLPVPVPNEYETQVAACILYICVCVCVSVRFNRQIHSVVRTNYDMYTLYSVCTRLLYCMPSCGVCFYDLN